MLPATFSCHSRILFKAVVCGGMVLWCACVCLLSFFLVLFLSAVHCGYNIRDCSCIWLLFVCLSLCMQVGTDFLEESITGFEDHVQSVDIAAFNKI